ncbi:MAG: phosphodiesterase [Zwartia sp.]|jgi:3',5'-cyclic AMP phosphodiesterase CpdA
MSTLFIQLTDLHIREPGRLAYGRLDTAPYLHRAVQTIEHLRQKPQAVVLTGDLTDFGRAAEYAHLRECLAPLTVPYYLLPGNHDDATQMRAAFPEHTYLGESGFVQYTLQLGPVRLITLDTTVAKQSHGALCAKRLAWLEEALDDSRDVPVVIAMHHPPFKTLIGHMDEIGLLEGAVELEALVAKYSNIERVICGHLHRPIDVRFGSTIASTSPAPAHQVALDLDPEAASQWILEPGGVKVYAWDPERGIVSHQTPCGTFEGPYPFHDGGKLID